MNGGGRGHPDDHTPPAAADLDAYVDGHLSGAARAAFESRLADDPALAARLDFQRQLERALRGLFVAPAFPGVPANGHPTPLPRHAASAAAASTAGRFAARWLRREVVLGGLFATAAVAIAVITWFAQFAPAGSRLTFETVYRQSVASGTGGCGGAHDGANLESVCQLSVGRALRLKSVPAGVEVLGVSEARVLSARTVVLRAKVDGAEVLVFADRAKNDDDDAGARPANGLRTFRRQMGDVVLYEVTPLAAPRLLDRYEFAEGG